jgi:hypothetical protein
VSVEGSQNDFAVLNRRAATRVKVEGTRPLASLSLWIWGAAVCPEPMIDIDLKPGETARWDNRYMFEERLAQAGANR